MNNLQTQYKNENVITAEWLLHFDSRKVRYQQRREEIECGGKACMNGEESIRASVGGGGVTATKAVELASPWMQHAEKWLPFVPEALVQLPPHMQALVRLMQAHRLSSGRVAKVAEAYAVEMRLPYVSEKRIDRLWEKTVNIMAREAIRRRVLN